jgi:DNA-binding CsgD family transcriptional regulator
MAEILALVLQHDEQAVLCAVEMALSSDVPTKTHVLNLLHRLVDGKPPAVPPVDAPQALVLNKEPRADVAIMIAQGRSPAAIAGFFGIGEGTARNHLKSTLKKVGVHTQGELASLIARLS